MARPGCEESLMRTHDWFRTNSFHYRQFGNARQLGRIKQVLPKRHSVQDLQEYVVEFRHERLQRFQFFLYREFELRGLTSD